MGKTAEERMATIEAKLDIIIEQGRERNGRLKDTEDDIVTLKIRDAKVATLVTMVVGAWSAFLAWMLRGE